MTEEETMVVEQQDQAAQATDQATTSEQEQAERQPTPAVETPVRKDVEYNWAEARRVRQEQDRIIREQNDTIHRLSNGQQTKEDPALSDDDLLTVKDLRKVTSKRDQEYARELQQYKEELQRLKYPDIDQVLSPENIANFEQNEPELAESLLALSGDPIKMKQAAYKLIKKTMPQNSTPSLEKKQAEVNAKKPVPVQAIAKGQSAIGNAKLFENGLTPELKKQLFAEMEAARRQG